MGASQDRYRQRVRKMVQEYPKLLAELEAYRRTKPANGIIGYHISNDFPVTAEDNRKLAEYYQTIGEMKSSDPKPPVPATRPDRVLRAYMFAHSLPVDDFGVRQLAYAMASDPAYEELSIWSLTLSELMTAEKTPYFLAIAVEAVEEPIDIHPKRR